MGPLRFCYLGVYSFGVPTSDLADLSVNEYREPFNVNTVQGMTCRVMLPASPAHVRAALHISLTHGCAHSSRDTKSETCMHETLQNKNELTHNSIPHKGWDHSKHVTNQANGPNALEQAIELMSRESATARSK